MDLSKYKAISISGIALKKLEINGVQIWKKGYTNQVPLSINADGSIYNGGLGYKNGYRVRSGGAEGAAASAACTGFIPVSAGDVVRLSGWDITVSVTENAINVANASFSNIGQIVSNYPAAGYGIFAVDGSYTAYSWSSLEKERDGVWKWIVPPAETGIAYIRVSGYEQVGGHGANMIVTINEEIE